jgi:hypothetical protein
MIGNFVTVQQLYDYAVQHDYLKADAYTVLDIINREGNSIDDVGYNVINIPVSPIGNSSAVDFSTLVEYTTEDLLALFST